MFGYVAPCKMELKVKDYEKFNAYYCGLCKSIKGNFGNLPRLALNYDMTFLAILLDALKGQKASFQTQVCVAHPFKKRLVIVNNKALDYAAYCNVALSYFKLLDNFADDKSVLSKLYASFLKGYIKKCPVDLKNHTKVMETALKELYSLEKNPEGITLDELSHPFAHLTGFVVSSYASGDSYEEALYQLGYNLGKWIYIIDALDDLEKDMTKNKFNALNSIFNTNDMNYESLFKELSGRMDFILTYCASQCSFYLEQLPLTKNKDILHNILNYGLMEKMDKVFKRSDYNHEKSL